MATATKCPKCEGEQLDDPRNKCERCHGQGELILCKICGDLQPEKQGVVGLVDVCAPCWGQHRFTGEPLESLGAKWAAERAGRETNLFDLRGGL